MRSSWKWRTSTWADRASQSNSGSTFRTWAKRSRTPCGTSRKITRPTDNNSRRGLKKGLSENSVVALVCVVAGLCLRHPACPTQSSPKGKRWYLTPLRVICGTPRILYTTLPMSLLISELMPPFWLTRTSCHPVLSTFPWRLGALTISYHFFPTPRFSCFSLLPATGSVSKFEASPCPGPCTAGTGAWRQPATIGPLPEDALFTWRTPASGHSATRPVQPWLIGGPSKKSRCYRCWSPWDLTSRKWDWIHRQTHIFWPVLLALAAKNTTGWQPKGQLNPGVLLKFKCNYRNNTTACFLCLVFSIPT